MNTLSKTGSRPEIREFSLNRFWKRSRPASTYSRQQKMDSDRARIQADLAGQLSGSIRCDDNYLQMYASDASIYEVQPSGVVFPANTDDVVACVRYAEANDLSVIPRGGGSNVTGGCVGNGLVLDFSYSMRRVKAVERDSVTVEPGIVLGELNRQLQTHD